MNDQTRQKLAAVSTAFEQTAVEDFVTERVAAGHSIRGLHPMTDAASRVIFEA